MYKGIDALSHMKLHHFSPSPLIIGMLQIISNINATVGTGRPAQVYPRRLNHHHHQYGDDDHGDQGPPTIIIIITTTTTMVTKDPPLSVLIGLHSVTLRDARHYRQNRITCGAHRISGATTHYQRYRIMWDAHYKGHRSTIGGIAWHRGAR